MGSIAPSGRVATGVVSAMAASISSDCSFGIVGVDKMPVTTHHGLVAFVGALALSLMLAACGGPESLPTASILGDDAEAPVYEIGPGDNMTIFVWRNPELTTSVPVRPDGRITIPLIEDLVVANKTPTELAREIEEELGVFVQDPIVTVIVTGFVGPFSRQVRVVGEAAQPQGIPYRANMTLLDVMISVGGLTEFADGNAAEIVRIVDGEQKAYEARITDLIKDGDISANVSMLPGDVLIIPESFF